MTTANDTDAVLAEGPEGFNGLPTHYLVRHNGRLYRLLVSQEDGELQEVQRVQNDNWVTVQEPTREWFSAWLGWAQFGAPHP